MITPYCTKFDRLTNRKFIEIVGTRGQILMAKCTKIDFGWDCAPDPAGGAYYAPSDPLVGWGGGYPLPIPYRLSPSAPMAPRPSRLRRSAASQRLKPTLLLPSGAATASQAMSTPSPSINSTHLNPALSIRLNHVVLDRICFAVVS